MQIECSLCECQIVKRSRDITKKDVVFLDLQTVVSAHLIEDEESNSDNLGLSSDTSSDLDTDSDCSETKENNENMDLGR